MNTQQNLCFRLCAPGFAFRITNDYVISYTYVSSADNIRELLPIATVSEHFFPSISSHVHSPHDEGIALHIGKHVVDEFCRVLLQLPVIR
jgi:hypothetical protein